MAIHYGRQNLIPEQKMEGLPKRELPMKLGVHTEKPDSRLQGIGKLADGVLADSRQIQHDTLSRWRSGVRIPPGSPFSYMEYMFSPIPLPHARLLPHNLSSDSLETG